MFTAARTVFSCCESLDRFSKETNNVVICAVIAVWASKSGVGSFSSWHVGTFNDVWSALSALLSYFREFEAFVKGKNSE